VRSPVFEDSQARSFPLPWPFPVPLAWPLIVDEK
jgi:hypothetical protein